MQISIHMSRIYFTNKDNLVLTTVSYWHVIQFLHIYPSNVDKQKPSSVYVQKIIFVKMLN